MEREAESIAVGPYLLEAGGAVGTVVVKSGSDRGAEAEALREALEEPGPREGSAPAVAAEVDAASEATAKIERAVALCKGIGEGQALNPAQLGLEVGALLDCLEKLDRKKEHKKSLQMARALATLLMLLKRWADLLQTLRIALRAGGALGDESAVAWAEHELGTLRLAAGDVEGADRDLCRAREIRERIGDRRGLTATERNMGALCDRVRSMLRDEKLVRPRARRGRSPARRLLALAAVFAAFGVGLAIGMAGGGDGQGTVAETTVTQEVGSEETSADEVSPAVKGNTDDVEVPGAEEVPGGEELPGEEEKKVEPPGDEPTNEEEPTLETRPPPVTETGSPEVGVPPVVK